jgi:hypothetical protein
VRNVARVASNACAPGALTRIQGGFGITGVSGSRAFSGWRGRAALKLSTNKTIKIQRSGYRPSWTSDASPNPQEQNGADRRNDQIAEPSIKFNVQHIGERAPNKRTGDADEQIGEKAVIAGGDLLGDVTGKNADDEHADKSDTRHGEQSLGIVHRDLPIKQAPHTA